MNKQTLRLFIACTLLTTQTQTTNHNLPQNEPIKEVVASVALTTTLCSGAIQLGSYAIRTPINLKDSTEICALLALTFQVAHLQSQLDVAKHIEDRNFKHSIKLQAGIQELIKATTSNQQLIKEIREIHADKNK